MLEAIFDIPNGVSVARQVWAQLSWVYEAASPNKGVWAKQPELLRDFGK